MDKKHNEKMAEMDKKHNERHQRHLERMAEMDRQINKEINDYYFRIKSSR
jgi:hypothetical protein